MLPVKIIITKYTMPPKKVGSKTASCIGALMDRKYLLDSIIDIIIKTEEKIGFIKCFINFILISKKRFKAIIFKRNIKNDENIKPIIKPLIPIFGIETK